MKEKDNLPNIIAVIALTIFLIFIFTVSRPKEKVEGLESGNIQHAIDTGQF